MAHSEFFGSMKHTGIFLGHKKNRGIFLGCETRTKGFFGVCQKKVVIFLGIKYEPLLDLPPPPPPIIKVCEWGPWDKSTVQITCILSKAIILILSNPTMAHALQWFCLFFILPSNN